MTTIPWGDKVWPALRLAALLLLALMAGCAGATVDPGPHPARVEVVLDASLPAGLVKETIRDNALEGLLPPSPGVLHEITGPYWDWRLYIMGPKGSLEPLRALGEPSLRRVPAKHLKARATFLLPPGRHRLLLLVDSYLEHSYYETLNDHVTESLSLKTYRQRLVVDLKAGRQRTVKYQLGPRP